MAQQGVKNRGNASKNGKNGENVINRSMRKGDELKKRGKINRKHLKNKGGLFSNCLQNGATFRAAAAAISLSVSQSIDSRNMRKLLNEAQATIQLGKILGLNCECKKEEVVSKIIELEEKDLERIEGVGVTS